MAAYMFLGLPVYVLLWSWISNRHKTRTQLSNPYLVGQKSEPLLQSWLWQTVQILEHYGQPSHSHETTVWLALHKKLCKGSRGLLDQHKCKCDILKSDSSDKRLAYHVFELQLDKLVARFPQHTFLRVLRLELNIHRSKNLYKASIAYRRLEKEELNFPTKLRVLK